MDNNNWRPTPNQGSVGGVGGGAGEPTMDTGDWRTQLPPDSRQRIVNKIMDTLKRHLPVSGQDGLHELRKIAIRFEEKIYTAATSQGDYLQKISLKMLTMETKSQNPTTSSLPSNSAGNSNKPPDSGVLGMQTQVHNQGQSLPIPLQSQARQQMLSQNIQNNVPSAGVQSSTSLQSTLPLVSGLNQAPISNVVGQNTTNISMQNISGNSQNPVGDSMGQGVPSNLFTNNQRQMQGRLQVPLQQQQQSQNLQQSIYQQQLQQKLLKQKIQQGNIPDALMQSHIQQQQQQQQQQNLLQNNQLQSSQQSIMQSSSVMQPSVMQSSSLSVLQQNQQPSIQQATQNMLQQHSQSVLRQQQQPQQAAVIHPQQTPMQQQPILPTQQQQLGQQPNATNMQQNQLIAQPSSVGDMQQQQQRLLGQQNYLQNMQQQQQQQQQQHQLMAQLNNLSNMHQQLGSQSNVSGLQQQQQQLLRAQSVNSSMQTSQHSVHMLQQSKVPVQQQSQQSAANFLPNQGQLSQSQPQPPQQQLMSQIQSHSQLQQQLGLQQQPNKLQRDMKQRLQTSGQALGSLLQPQNVIDQQKQFYQSAFPDTSSTSLDSTAQTGHGNGADWQEEVYQKIKAMKEMYLPELNEMYQKISAKVQQQDSLSQQPKSDQLEKLKTHKTMLERLITFLQVSENNILPYHKEKLGLYEKLILNFINTYRHGKPVSLLQQGQLPPPHMHSMQQPQSQITQMQSHENQMNPQLQSMNLQGSVATMQQNNMTSLQHNSLSLSGVSTAQQNMMNSLQPGFNLDSGQGNALSSLQPVAMGSLQQNPVSAPQQANLNNNLSAQSGVNALQPTINSLQSSSNMLQQQHLEQHQKQRMMQQTQQLKQQYQQRQMLQQLMLKQQLMQQQQQQLHEQPKQQMSAQLQSQQIPQLHQINDANDLKIQQGLGVKLGVFQQHLPAGQCAAYPHQQLKPGASFPTSSPQLLQAASPQILQHSSPQVDQQNVLSSITKAGTPMQSANSPFVVPSPSTPLAPPPMPGDSEKPISGVSSLSNAGNIGHQQTSGVGASALSLAIGTPGISASPLLTEFTGQEGTHGNALMNVSGKSSITERPLECLIKAVKSMAPTSLSASVSDISSVVSMIDRVAGSAPGNGSRAAVGEDLEAMTKVPFLDKVIEDVNKHHSRRWIVKAGNFFNIYVFGSWQFLTFFAAICLMVLISL